MKFHLENKIHFNEESEFKNLYSWSLQEVDGTGKKIGKNQIPWEWSLYFTASELRYVQSINIDTTENANITKTKENSFITSVLHSGVCRNGKSLEQDVYYSMFGTNRPVRKFNLQIHKSEEISNEERCCIWGSVSYTAEMDFKDETTDDIIEIHIDLSSTRFNKIIDMLSNQCIDMLEICLGKVSGFYSEWSPSITTDSIKILVSSEEQEIIGQQNEKLEVPRLGNVGKFNITIIQRKKLNVKQDFEAIDVNKLFKEVEYTEDDIIEEQFKETPDDKSSLILAQLTRNETALAKLSTPLWLIFIFLCLLLIKLVV